MDDEGNELEITDDNVLTPKGFLMKRFKAFGATREQAMEEWHKLEAFCMKQLTTEDGPYPALIFDGEGGSVVGVIDELNDGR